MQVSSFVKTLVILLGVTCLPNLLKGQNSTSVSDSVHYRQEIAKFEKELAVKGMGNSRLYNLAVNHSLLGEGEIAISYLQTAVDNGLLILDAIVDEDLQNTRTSKKWPAIKKKIIGNWYTYYPFGDAEYALLLIKMKTEYILQYRMISKAEDAYGEDSDEYLNEIQKTREIAKTNGVELDSLIEIHGWPRQNLVGQEQLRGAAMILTYSDTIYQKKYLPEIIKAVEYGELDGRYLATLTDKILISDGEKQLYGTQYLYNDSTDNYEMAPIENEIDLDKRRLELGLDSMDVYLKRINTNQE